MAIGENSITDILRLNITAMSIEKLIDDILKVRITIPLKYMIINKLKKFFLGNQK